MNNRKESLITGIVKYLPRKIKRRLIGHLENDTNLQAMQIKELRFQVNSLTSMVARTMMNDMKFQFYGQVDQDLYAFLFFGGKKDGFYVDIGANDGVSFSNTYIFEQFGWNGICVEPLPDIFSKLRQNRKCACYNVAVAAESGNEINFIRASGVEGLSGLESEMTEVHKKRIVNEHGKIETIGVKTLSFDDLMNKHENAGGGGVDL